MDLLKLMEEMDATRGIAPKKRSADTGSTDPSKKKRDEKGRPSSSRAEDPPRASGAAQQGQGMSYQRHDETQQRQSNGHPDRGGHRGGYGGDRDRGSYGGERRDDRGGNYKDDRGGDRRDDRGYRGGRIGDDQRGGYRGGGRGGGGYGGGPREFKREDKPEHEHRGGYGQQTLPSGEPGDLEVSMNALKISADREHVYRFHFDMFIIRPNRPDGTNSGPKDICITPRSDQAAIQKERCVFNVLYTLIKREPETFGTNRYAVVFDGGYALYSVSEELYQVASRAKKEWTFSKEEVTNIFPDKVSGYLKNFKEFKVSLAYTSKLYISGPKFDPSDPSRESQKFFDVITSALAHEGNYLNYGQRSYDSNARPRPIGQAKEVRNGLEKTTKTIGNDSIVLQVSSTATAFHSAYPVLKYCQELLGCREERDTAENLSKNKSACRQSAAALKNIFLEVTHLPKNKKRIFALRDIEWDRTAANTHFQTKEGAEITVKEYFRQTYNKHIKYPDLPLAVEKVAGRKCYYPLEYCQVTQGHRIGTAQLEKQAEQVHKEARQLPYQQQEKARMELEKMQLIHGQNRYLDAFGIKIDSQFFTVNAKILAAPMKEGGGHQTIAAQGREHLRAFFSPAVVPSSHKVFVIILDRCIDERDADNFYRKLSSEAKNKGMTVPSTSTIKDARAEGNLERLFDDCKKDKAAILIFITRDKLDNVHHVVKKLEEQFGVQTQHISLQTVQKFTRGGGAQTIENVLRKFNPKLGGVNEAIVAPSSEAASRDILKNKLFVGLELSHPAAQCLFDRQFGVEVKNPTVIGLCHSLDIPERVTGRFWYQNPREYSIKHLEEFFGKSLDVHRKKVKKFPKDIVIYRAGASEGDRGKVDVEIQAIKAALVSRGLNARIVLLFCVAHSGMTLAPTNIDTSRRLKPIEANVPSGTSLSDSANEFLIKSQNSNIGTSKMLRIIVHTNEADIPVDYLKKIAHWHAFAHSASTCPTSKPHVLYGAMELAKRGANHYKQDQGGFDDTRSMCSGGSSRQDLHPGETDEEYKKRKNGEADKFYLSKSHEAQHAFEHQFWA